ncbi:MAG: hypothetical protein ACOYD7_07940 [Raoultibacter sp.]|jgi:hypothetical protein
MARTLPEDVRETIRQLVYELADQANYLAQGRVENGQFMAQLVNHPQIGGVLCEYMSEGDVKTYIKDAVLNRYAKEKRADAQDGFNTEELILESFGKSVQIEEKTRVSLYKSTERMASYCVVGNGTSDKWETALRHALIYVSNLPESTQKQDIRIALRCTSPRGKLSMSDKDCIRGALNRIGVEYFCIEF